MQSSARPRIGNGLFNSALVIDPKGQVIKRDHKVQLAEDWPEEGDHLSVFRVDGVPCSIIICHDERYPELVRLPVLAGSRVVFYLSHESGLRQESKLTPIVPRFRLVPLRTLFTSFTQTPPQTGHEWVPRPKPDHWPRRPDHP